MNIKNFSLNIKFIMKYIKLNYILHFYKKKIFVSFLIVYTFKYNILTIFIIIKIKILIKIIYNPNILILKKSY